MPISISISLSISLSLSIYIYIYMYILFVNNNSLSGLSRLHHHIGRRFSIFYVVMGLGAEIHTPMGKSSVL